ncbi:hypothetical protein RU639_011588 [Aspergillus parasiticus]
MQNAEKALYEEMPLAMTNGKGPALYDVINAISPTESHLYMSLFYPRNRGRPLSRSRPSFEYELGHHLWNGLSYDCVRDPRTQLMSSRIARAQPSLAQRQ